MTERIPHPDAVQSQNPAASGRSGEAPPLPATPPVGGGGAVSELELLRRQVLIARARGELTPELQRRLGAAQVRQAQANAERAALAAAADRQRARPKLTNPFDPGPEKLRWAREGTQPDEQPEQPDEQPDEQPEQPDEQPERVRARERRKARERRRARPWKSPRRKPKDPSDVVLRFARDRGWTREREKALARRIKKNDATIAHPRAAEATLRTLSLWAQAAVRRAFRSLGWTFADESARRHVAMWALLEDFARPVAFSRPRQYRSRSGATRFVGVPRFAFAVRGWAQAAIALAISGAATTDAGADPVDVKTVQRHMEIASTYGAVDVVTRNPDAAPEFRGRPTASNPRGWPINEYWLPTEKFHKPAFVGSWFDADGNPIALEEALAIELVPRAKRPRRMREAEQPPPPIA